MASYFTLTLDTTAPTGGKITIASPTNNPSVTATLSASGATQMKLYGDIVSNASSSTKITESAASWVNYATSATVVLATGDGAKTVYAKFRDDVGNESAAVSAVVTLDTTAPVVTISTGPDYSTISEVLGFDTCAFSWSADEAIKAYKVCVVPANTSAQSAGIQIGTTNGSTNTSGAAVAANTTVSTTIKASDLKAASSGDGAKIIKVFVQDTVGNWSV